MAAAQLQKGAVRISASGCHPHFRQFRIEDSQGNVKLTPMFLTQKLSRIYLSGNQSFGFDFNNICAALSAQPPDTRSFVKLLSKNASTNCTKLLMDAVK